METDYHQLFNCINQHDLTVLQIWTVYPSLSLNLGMIFSYSKYNILTFQIWEFLAFLMCLETGVQARRTYCHKIPQIPVRKQWGDSGLTLNYVLPGKKDITLVYFSILSLTRENEIKSGNLQLTYVQCMIRLYWDCQPIIIVYSIQQNPSYLHSFSRLTQIGNFRIDIIVFGFLVIWSEIPGSKLDQVCLHLVST